MLPIDQLIRPLSKDEVKASLYTLLDKAKLPTKSWQPGAVVRTVIAVVSTVFAGFTQVVAVATRSKFLELAGKNPDGTEDEGSVWLTVLAKEDYDVDRIEATFAPGVVTLTNAGGGLFDLDPGDLIVKNTATGKTYTNDDHIVLNPLATLEDVAIHAQEAGGDSTAAPGQIDALVTGLLLVTVTNPDAVVGLDAEGNADLRERCIDSLGALSPFGPAGAYRYVAKTPSLNGGVPVNRVRVSKESAVGHTTVTCATGNDELTDDQVALVDAGVRKNANPYGFTCESVSASGHSVAVTYEAWADAAYGATEEEIKAKVANALTDPFFRKYRIGGIALEDDGPGYLFVERIRSAILGAHPALFNAVVSLPAADVELDEGEVATLGAVTATVHLVVVQPQ